jgi:hypothetical protein
MAVYSLIEALVCAYVGDKARPPTHQAEESLLNV